MVKRTAVVLGVVSLMIVMAGSAFAQGFGLPTPACFGASMCEARPLFVPVDCPDPIQRTIVKKWEAKIVGPCPPVSPPAGGGCGVGVDDREGLLLSLATAVMTPMDVLFGPFDGVYGCMEMGSGGICGSCFGGPFPRALLALGNVGCGTTSSFFGGLW
ncbi:MAG: hypothetical protein RDU20_17250 [Desulfomonilaceae bacterium]|nr:hypothetical protein [Desulfomonilaceae bacterium]